MHPRDKLLHGLVARPEFAVAGSNTHEKFPYGRVVGERGHDGCFLALRKGLFNAARKGHSPMVKGLSEEERGEHEKQANYPVIKGAAHIS